MSSLGVLWPQSNLKVLYHLENVNDSSGNGKTLSTVGGDESFVTGKYGVDLKTLGTGSVNRTDTAGIDSRGNLTFMFWAKINTLLGTNGQSSQFIKLTESGKQTISFDYYRISSKSHRLRFYDTTPYASVDTRFYAGVWFHVAGTVNSSYYMKLYLNGNYVGNNTGSNGSAAYSSFEVVPLTSPGFAGEIDELLVFQEVKSAQWIRNYYAWATGKML